GSTKLINIGANRWAFKPEIGFSYPVKRLDLDLYGGAWFFTDNNSYYPVTVSRTQEPLSALQAHVSYTNRRGLWAAFDSTWFGGGGGVVKGGPATERQSNTRLGVTVSMPLPDRQSIKFAYSSGVNGTIGSSFNTFSISWQKMWLR